MCLEACVCIATALLFLHLVLLSLIWSSCMQSTAELTQAQVDAYHRHLAEQQAQQAGSIQDGIEDAGMQQAAMDQTATEVRINSRCNENTCAALDLSRMAIPAHAEWKAGLLDTMSWLAGLWSARSWGRRQPRRDQGGAVPTSAGRQPISRAAAEYYVRRAGLCHTGDAAAARQWHALCRYSSRSRLASLSIIALL